MSRPLDDQEKRQIISLLLAAEHYLELAEMQGVKIHTRPHKEYKLQWEDGATIPDGARQILFAGAHLGSAVIRLETIWEILNKANVHVDTFADASIVHIIRHSTCHPEVLGQSGAEGTPSEVHKRKKNFQVVLEMSPATLFERLSKACKSLRPELQKEFTHEIPR